MIKKMHAVIINMSELPGLSDKRKASAAILLSAFSWKGIKDCGDDPDFHKS